jgi:alpha-D-xyloside xylohydrolase
MVDALRGCLSLSLSGLCLVTHDAGGFHTPRSIEIPERILDGKAARYTADVDPELFGRWAQWAAFSPVTRFHGTGRREPTAYPEPWRSAAIAALRRRKDILPLLRAALTEAQRTGMPLMRPTALTHPHDPAARRCWYQYQLGSDLIVAPVLAPGGKTTVWLPDAEWEPILGAPPLRSPGLHDITVPPNAFPVYARPGVVPKR